MSYDAAIVQRASARLARRKEIRERRRWDLEQELYRRQPRLRELDRAIGGTMAELAGLAISGKPIQADGPEIADIRRRNLELQAQRAELLHTLGYEPDALDPTPACTKCGDSGWAGAEMCTCLKELCAQEQMKALTALLNLTDEQNFDRLRLDVYSDQPWEGKRSPRENMKRVVTVCEGFARRFPDYPLHNLLLSGGTGLGKTFLSGCIAREVSGRGYSVVYDTAISLFSTFEAKKFSRDLGQERQARDDTRRYLNCDLLILDDLGSELTTPLAQSTLYEVVNSRLQGGKHTIISTNLSMEQIGARYTPQVVSRLAGAYQELTFYGDDIRRMRR
ncbi:MULTISPECIES: ATP-binding protein [unclassified Pseudoflavonifractor]|uniref:ATP-binding protein n=1 Tax=unclassified Pseudoflavonifractor TaxID=2628103 RepID=UPI000B37DE26|nr:MULTISPECIES: ATP-binding protein [unclassified Pseudoflavonifractor]OUN98068.1 DNA replication protein DnaC [Pseudoflavonifractor sp. An44]OUP41222.1 DNA replication protein DnaC [Pseudoflavonifractor sp. An187]